MLLLLLSEETTHTPTKKTRPRPPRSITPGAHLFEATAGNTGTALALVASRRGYRLTVVVPDKVGGVGRACACACARVWGECSARPAEALTMTRMMMMTTTATRRSSLFLPLHAHTRTHI